MEAEVDEYGIVNAPVHDGRVISLHADGGATLSFTIRNTRNQDVTFTLRGLVEMRILSFGRQPICSEVYCWDLAHSVPMMWEAPDNPWTILFGEFRENDAARARERLISTYPDYKLVALSCSYGGDLAAVCSRLEVTLAVNE